MGRVEGKVAFVTGAARGQGRSHAVMLAAEGADVIISDICGAVATSVASPTSKEDLEETARQIEALDRRVVMQQLDVRDHDAVLAAVNEGVAELGRLDIVCANAGMMSLSQLADLEPAVWQETMDILLTGVWHTCKAAARVMVPQGTGGSIIMTSSAVGMKGAPNIGHYAAAKHGVIGLMKSLAMELAPHSIRVNCINPGAVNTAFIHNQPTYKLFTPDLDEPDPGVVAERFQAINRLPVPWVEPEDISYAVVYLASNESRYVTGITLPVDAGNLL